MLPLIPLPLCSVPHKHPTSAASAPTLAPPHSDWKSWKTTEAGGLSWTEKRRTCYRQPERLLQLLSTMRGLQPSKRMLRGTRRRRHWRGEGRTRPQVVAVTVVRGKSGTRTRYSSAS
ncbi:hypothetical protein ABFX02_02G085800 [Erythranthe guttata]